MMAIETVREYGRLVTGSTGGDASILADASIDPSRLQDMASATDRPSLYDLWRVTLERVTNRKGVATGYKVNIRKWTRSAPTDKRPKGFEGPVTDEYHGGVALPVDVAAALAAAISDAAADGIEMALTLPKDASDALAAKDAEIAELRARLAAAQGE
jgi:hypothetical protein